MPPITERPVQMKRRIDSDYGGQGGEKSCLRNRETGELRRTRGEATPVLFRDVDQVRGREQEDPPA